MASITANTKHKVPVPKSKKIGGGGGGKLVPTKKGKGGAAGGGGGAGGRRGSVAPLLKPSTLTSPEKIDELLLLKGDADDADDATTRRQRQRCLKVKDLCRLAMGGEQSLLDKSKPHAASTTRDRAGAAADVAVAAKHLGIRFVLKECNVMAEMQLMLFPEGISKTFAAPPSSSSSGGGGGGDDYETNNDETNKTTFTGGYVGGLKPSASAVSLTSLDTGDTTASVASNDSMTMGTDSKRGKTTPASAREGSLLLIRAFCECLGKQAEPYMVGAFLMAALDECGSNSSSVREAAEDTAAALVKLANPWSFPRLIAPLILKALKSTEWRVKANAMDTLAKCAGSAPTQVCQLLPTLIPAVTNQVWDTKAQVNKSAGSCLLAICQTCTNKDIRPAIPAVVAAVCKPSDTNKAVSELMGTTFVVTVDAPTLAILCPVLSRALKEKLAIHKRAACIVINNMSKLVGSPEDVAPFGGLLVPELKKVANSVQFEEIRDEALKALASLTKALGAAYSTEGEEKDESAADKMASEQKNIEAEQKKIEAERAEQQRKEEAMRLKEEEEKKKFKEAMDAQRELNRLEAEKAKKEKEEEKKKKEAAKLSTKGGTGKCQMCGLKKCRKTCTFYTGP
eukprot:CAMPEP_0113500232 /NCGR_PEP_ID=MMETSP0014_2-20120614/32197_1 /TAXON_ID=2857 /ORGANISM="Nitzschia sp." /LENGTH=623 /DNA_ID=CAMNT_0000394511 /DNA_START=175 /DNA_END=2046 /DNA_ORIENTATION=+ /assembly_acc=CAM_ASM_000159